MVFEVLEFVSLTAGVLLALLPLNRFSKTGITEKAAVHKKPITISAYSVDEDGNLVEAG